MKINCLKQDLISAIAIVIKGVASKPQTPILSGIYLNASDGELELQSTNYDTSFIVKIPAETIINGKIVLPARYFQDLIRKMPGDNINLECNNHSAMAQIKSDNSNYSLRTMSLIDFPVQKKADGNIRFQIKDTDLQAIVKKTTFSCSRDEQRPIFTGCELKVENNKLTVAATNIHRLAVKTAPISIESQKDSTRLIAPARFLDDVVHILNSDVPTIVTVSSSPHHISFEFDNVYMTSRVIDGAFPDYNRVIPSEDKFYTHVSLDVAEFTAAVDRVSLIARTDQYNIIKLNFADNHLNITSNSPEVGDAAEIIPADIKGVPIKIAFNASYIIEALKVIDGKNCILHLQEPNSEGQSLAAITITDEKDYDFIYIVTPVRIK